MSTRVTVKLYAQNIDKISTFTVVQSQWLPVVEEVRTVIKQDLAMVPSGRAS